MRWAKHVLLTLFGMIAAQGAWGAISSQNVLVLYNPAWTDGTHDGSYLADYYANQRGIPADNLLGVTGLGIGEEISATDYLNVIWPQVHAALETRDIDVIVTTKGMPLRIRNDLANPGCGYTYTDPFGIQRPIYTWQQYSSLESELTRINTIGVRSGSDWLNTALLQMGDQTYWWPLNPNPSLNPYYLCNSSFDHSNSALGGMYLTARLDGFTVSDVTASITKAKNAFLIPNSRYVVADDDPNTSPSGLVDKMPQLLSALGSNKCLYDNTDSAVTTASKPVIGYVSYGIHDGSGGLEPGYIPNQLNFSLANGAVFTTHESYNAITFELPESQDQGLLAEWLAKGGTAGVGNVQEPLNGTPYEANEDQLFKMLVGGYTFAEASWSSLRQLSYVNTVVGDPLMVWRQVLPGDANCDGLVGSADLAVLGGYWGTTGESGGFRWKQGDFNGDGLVGSADLAVLGGYWGQHASWFDGDGSVPPLDLEAFFVNVPEPSTMSFILTSLFTLLAGCGWKQLRSPAPPKGRNNYINYG
ncbi:MAG: TIGR03790 family protein [Pirellulales bacterium]|nr:TIGR03790 family protein [Pirellulales bacterium]